MSRTGRVSEQNSGADSLGVVIIGRNEGERLRVCFTSVLGGAERVVYVDSGSTDNSRELARGLGAQVIELDLSQPFSAARARNAGWRYLARANPGLAFVQFVDGDCELDSEWMKQLATTSITVRQPLSPAGA